MTVAQQRRVAQVMGCAIRVSTLDADGTPNGPSYVTDCLSKLTITPSYTDGQEIKETNACGSNYIDFLADSTLDRCDIDLDLLLPDPALSDILLGGSKSIPVGAGAAEGWAMPPIGPITGQLAIEIWAQRVFNGILDPTYPYAWWAVPLAKNMRMGAREFSNTAQHNLITGQAYQNVNYFDGPGNDWPASSDRIAQWIPTATIPDGTTGAVVTVTGS